MYQTESSPQDWKANTYVVDTDEQETCLLDAFFKREQQKPPHLRSPGAFLVCRCKKCRLRGGIL